MDWCLNVFGEWRMTSYAGAGRTVKMLFMALAFWIALFWISLYTTSTEMPAAVRNDAAAVSGREAAVLAAGAISGSIVIPAVPEVTMDEIPSGTEKMTAGVIPSAVQETPGVPDRLTASEIPEVTETPAISDIAESPATPIMPDMPESPETQMVPEAPIVPDIPAAQETPAISDTPAVPDSSEDTSSSSGTVGGFTVDENGIICGVADAELAISEGVMKFPSEGCCGISAGAFSDGFPSVLEVYIPVNITEIEPGAFAGLVNVEWYTAEPGSGFSDNMGVLLSDNGTNIFAFPSGRTGSYKVPAEITGFSQNVFADAAITAIDMTECAAEVPSGLPEHIEVIMREDY